MSFYSEESLYCFIKVSGGAVSQETPFFVFYLFFYFVFVKIGIEFSYCLSVHGLYTYEIGVGLCFLEVELQRSP